MRTIWDKFVAWLEAIPRDKGLHFVAGVIVAAFFALALGVKAAILPALIAGLFKEAFDKLTTGEVDWLDLVATCLGGLLVQAFILLGIYWS